LERLTSVETRRIHVDKGYRGHKRPHKCGQVRRVAAAIRREMKLRAAVESVIGHVKAERGMERNFRKGRDGDRINAVLAAAPATTSPCCSAGSPRSCAPTSPRSLTENRSPDA
jgi:IS5 family transposase